MLKLPVELIYMIYKLSNEQTQRSFKQTCRAFAVEPIWVPPVQKGKVFITIDVSGSLTIIGSHKSRICFDNGISIFDDNKTAYDFLCIRGLKIEKETKEPVLRNRHDYILEFCKYTAVVSAICKKCGKIELPVMRKMRY